MSLDVRDTLPFKITAEKTAENVWPLIPCSMLIHIGKLLLSPLRQSSIDDCL